MNTSILIVEDEAITGMDIKNSLEELGYAVSGIAISGKEAIELAEKNKPDLILMDIVLIGEMDGTQAAHYITNHFKMPIIFLTAYNDSNTFNRAKFSAPYGYLKKPFEIHDLRIAIELALFKHEMATNLKSSELRFHNTFDYATVGMALINADGNFLEVNQVFSKMLGYSPDEFQTLSIDDITHPDEIGIDLVQFNKLINNDILSAQFEKRFCGKNAQVVWCIVGISLGRGNKGEPLYFIYQAQDVTARKLAENELVYLSEHDILTNVYNRSAFEEVLKREIAASIKDKTSLAVLLLDVDNFKMVNDTFGHRIGDKLLVQISQKLQQAITHQKFIARLGGDEFIIILPNIKDINEVDQLAKHMISRFSTPFKIEDHYFHATVSIGISTFPSAGEKGEALLQNADIALYAVKALGGNNYQFFSNETHYTFKQRSLMERFLPEATEKNQFFLAYQPIHKLPGNNIVAMEVLLRWNHPQQGLILPDDFIPIAEKNGFIVSIDEWVLKNACRQYVEWLNKGFFSEKFKFAINVSPIHLAKTHFINFLLDILQDSGMPPKSLELELTESAVMTNIIDLDPVFEQLQKLGITISIDDFGVGYSSLSRLKNLPISTLKIDKSFINNLDRESDAMIVKSIIALGNTLGLNVITEGVETEKQLNLLLQYGCPMAQGFYFEKPAKTAEMENLLKQSCQKNETKV